MADMIAKVTGKVQELIFDQQAFMNHIRSGNLEEVRKALDDPRMALNGPNVCDEIGQTPIHCAAGRGDVKILKLLVKKGSDINAVTDDQEYKRTALHICCMLGMNEALKFLLQCGANPLLQDMKGKTPIYYARDAECVRALQSAGTLETNIQRANRAFLLMERIVGQGNVSVAVTQHLGEVEDATRIVRTFQGWQSAVQGKLGKGPEIDVPQIKVPGLSSVLSALRSMKDDLYSDIGYFAFMPRGDAKETLAGMIKVLYMDYNGVLAMKISDIFVQPRWRRQLIGTWLVAHVCDFALRGPRHISKVFAVVPDGNRAGQQFFAALGFHKEPAYNVPWKYRRAGQAVYHVHDSGMALAHLASMIEKRAEREDEWITSEELEKRKAAEIEAANRRDFEAWERKMQEADKPRPLEKLSKPGSIGKGIPLLPLRHETERLRKIGVLATKVDSYFVCENDRIPLDIIDRYRANIERSRRIFEWEMRPLYRKEKQSRILNCPRELKNAWLEELDADANAALPSGWIAYFDDSGEQMYFNMNTHLHSKDRPLSEITKAMQKEAAIEMRQAKVKRKAVPAVTQMNGESNIVDHPFVINVVAKRQEEQERREQEVITRRKFEETVDLMVEKAKDFGGTFENVLEAIEKYVTQNGVEERDKQFMISRARKCFADSEWAKPWRLDAVSPPKPSVAEDVVSSVPTPIEVIRPKQIIQDHTSTDDSITTISGQSFGTSASIVGACSERGPAIGQKVVRANSQAAAAANWVDMCAEREKAIYDADILLQQFAPPMKSDASKTPTTRPETAPTPSGSECIHFNTFGPLCRPKCRPMTAPEADGMLKMDRLDDVKVFPRISASTAQDSKQLDSRPSTGMSQASTIRPCSSASNNARMLEVAMPCSPYRR